VPTPVLLLILAFAGIAVAAGVAAAIVAGPRHAAALPVPIVAAFAALWVVGHQLSLRVGPRSELFGFEVHLLFDVLVALLAALAAARLQRPWIARLLRSRRSGA
jgi:hypothetical protein